MRLISPVLAIAALASGCGNDKPKDPPAAADPAAKPAEPPEPPPQAAKVAAAPAVKDASPPWQIDVGRAGPVSIDMSIDALRAIPDLTLKNATVEAPVEYEDGEMDTEKQEVIQVWANGEHQLTLFHASLAKDDRPGFDKDNFEDRVYDIEVRGSLPRVAPIAGESPAGVGTTAQELQDRYGAPSALEPSPWSTGMCATFEKQRAATFCFDTQLTSFAKVRAKNLAVTSMQVRK